MSCIKQVLHQKKKIYYEVSETAFKLRYANFKKSFNNIKYQTELSNKYWNTISASKTLNISWKIFRTHKSFNQRSKRFLLCVNEKPVITLLKDDYMLNKRSEVINKCRHRNKYILDNYDSKY